MNALTFDVEDWYHPLEPDCSRWSRYADRIDRPVRALLDLLDDHSTRATFFVLGDVARRHPQLVREICARRHQVASHGMWHRFVYAQTPCEFEADVRESLDLLGSIVGHPITAYRAPYFSVTRRSLWALPILCELGIQHDSSIFPVLNHRYGIPDAPRLPYVHQTGLFELPPSTYPVVGHNLPIAGGVYFRAFPYALTRSLFRRLEARSEPIVFYLHPWEIDPDHPRVAVGGASLRVRHYWGLRETEGKLRSLMRDFRFGTIQEVCDASIALGDRQVLQ